MQRAQFRTRIKFCGLTRAGDIRLACELGVDAVGLVFAHRSRRRVEPAAAAALRDAVSPLVDVVALFMDNPAEEVREAIAQARPSLLQFHGSEDDAFCRRFGVPYFKGVGLGGAAEAGIGLRGRFRHAAGFVLDGHAPGEPGGSGKQLQAAAIPADLDRPWLLAGGLDAGNVGAAIRAMRPWGVDVAGGIEMAPGLKDGTRMREFVDAVSRADRACREAAGFGYATSTP